MDRADKDEMEQEKRNKDPNPYNSHGHGVSLDWPFCSTNVPMNLVSSGNSLAVCKENEMGSSAPMEEPFAAALWDHPTNVQNLGYCDISVQGTSNALGIGKVSPPPSLRSDMNWNSHVSMLKEGIFLSNAPGTIPESLTQFPTDSGFIERAARFSCFNGGSFSDMVNPLSVHESSVGLFHRGVVVRMPEVFPGGQPQRREVSVGETSKDVILSGNKGASEGSPLKNGGRSESTVRSLDEARQIVGGFGNDSDEAEFSGGGGQDDAATIERTAGEPSVKGLSSKKRKRNGPAMDAGTDAAVARQPSDNGKDSDETEARTEPNPNSVVGKSSGKNNSQTSDPPKEYIHVRARRGQATNSHSLAERVRREKISERMKFLQDLVPGCSKVTGKAVMLDEIINYVQSLQRQVEFLSMKLATVNPRVDFNLDSLLPKDILQSRPGPSSTLGFFPDMASMVYPPGGLIQAAVNPDAMRRTIPGQIMRPIAGGGFKEAAQMLNMWDNELDHVLQMGFPGGATSNSEDVVDASVQPDHAKIER